MTPLMDADYYRRVWREHFQRRIPNKATMLQLITSISSILSMKPKAWLVVGMTCLLSISQVDGGSQVRTAQELTITASFSDKESVAPGEPIELTLSRPLSGSEGRVAVMIGETDLTGLFTADGVSL